jgi:hypothetical protein
MRGGNCGVPTHKFQVAVDVTIYPSNLPEHDLVSPATRLSLAEESLVSSSPVDQPPADAESAISELQRSQLMKLPYLLDLCVLQDVLVCHGIVLRSPSIGNRRKRAML